MEGIVSACISPFSSTFSSSNSSFVLFKLAVHLILPIRVWMSHGRESDFHVPSMQYPACIVPVCVQKSLCASPLAVGYYGSPPPCPVGKYSMPCS